MERPSHSNFRISHPFSHRLASLCLAISLPFAVLFALTHGLGTQIIDHFGPLVYVPDKEPVKPRTPPPAAKMENVVQPRVDMPVIKLDPDQKDDRIAPFVTPLSPKPVETQTMGPDLAPVAIKATHTIPPYPPLAQRLGEEGKVTLRLTVLPDGKVGKAEIVTSSGRDDLDQSARDWIVAHWTYRPALEKGQPAISQTVATIIFSLSNAR